MEKKMTYATAIDKAIAGEVTAEVKDRLIELKASLAHKPSAKKTAEKSAEDAANKTLMAEVLTLIGKPATVSEILATGKFPTGTSSPKVTSILTKMVADGTVVNTKDKKKSFYALAEVETEAE